MYCTVCSRRLGTPNMDPAKDEEALFEQLYNDIIRSDRKKRGRDAADGCVDEQEFKVSGPSPFLGLCVYPAASRSTRWRSPPCFKDRLLRAKSTRIRRMASAAAEKK